jgi:hypothetical protein
VKLAGADFLIWLVIFVVISLVQGWKHLQGKGAEEEEEPQPELPLPRPERSRPAPASAPPPVVRQPQTWQADPRQMDELRRRLKAKLDARQAAPPPIVETVPAPTPVTPAAKTVTRTAAATIAVPRHAWAERLRQRHGARDAVIAAEIFGAPKGA